MSIDNLYKTLSSETKLIESNYRHSSIYYIRSLLNNKFNLKLSLKETEVLLKEEFDWDSDSIPSWYKTKWF